MLTIRAEQFAVLQEDLTRRFVHDLRAELRAAAGARPIAHLDEAIAAARSDAVFLGFTQLRHVGRYAAFLLEHGIGSEAHAVVLDRLCAVAGTAEERIALLDRLARELSKGASK